MQESKIPFSIRPAEPSDIDDLLRLIRGIAEYAKLTDQFEATPERLHDSLFGSKPVARALVANKDGAGIVGYAIFFYNFSSFLAKPGIYLEDLYVSPEYRGQGMGNALFKQVAQIARDEDCERVDWMTLNWNSSAIDFYKAKGASFLEDWRLLRFERKDIENFAAS